MGLRLCLSFTAHGRCTVAGPFNVDLCVCSPPPCLTRATTCPHRLTTTPTPPPSPCAVEGTSAAHVQRIRELTEEVDRLQQQLKQGGAGAGGAGGDDDASEETKQKVRREAL